VIAKTNIKVGPYSNSIQQALSVKLLVAWIVEKFLPFLWNLKVRYHVPKSLPLERILSQMNSADTHPSSV
jgi:hypothetical protein